jgi:K+-transporting ATPase KdpF subunit
LIVVGNPQTYAAHPIRWNSRGRDAGFNDVAVHWNFLRPGVSLRQGLPEVEVDAMPMDVITVIALLLSVLLLAYLILTLLFPEKF